jgi:hypothetical protein
VIGVTSSLTRRGGAGEARRVIHKVDEQTGQEYLLVQDKHCC